MAPIRRVLKLIQFKLHLQYRKRKSTKVNFLGPSSTRRGGGRKASSLPERNPGKRNFVHWMSRKFCRTPVGCSKFVFCCHSSAPNLHLHAEIPQEFTSGASAISLSLSLSLYSSLLSSSLVLSSLLSLRTPLLEEAQPNTSGLQNYAFKLLKNILEPIRFGLHLSSEILGIIQ